MTKKDMFGWEEEFKNLPLDDKRLKERLLKIMEDFYASPDQSIFLSSGSRSDAKAVYRFLSNETIKFSPILKSIQQFTLSRIQTCGETTILALQDTTSIGFPSREKIDGMGYYCSTNAKGMQVHSSIAITASGIPLGFLHQEYFTRDCSGDKTMTKKQKEYRPIEEKESYRWLHTMEEAQKAAPPEVTCSISVTVRVIFMNYLTWRRKRI